MADFNAILFHCPFSRLVEKSVARLSFLDQIRTGFEFAPESLKNNFGKISLAAAGSGPNSDPAAGPCPNLANPNLAAGSGPNWRIRIWPPVWVRIWLNSDLAAGPGQNLANLDPELAKKIEREFLVHSLPIFAEKTERSLEFSRHVGNMYCPSLYAGLCSHLAR